MHLRTGGSAVECHGPRLTRRQVDDVLVQVEAVAGFLDSYSPDARQALSRRGARGRVPPG